MALALLCVCCVLLLCTPCIALSFCACLCSTCIAHSTFRRRCSSLAHIVHSCGMMAVYAPTGKQKPLSCCCRRRRTRLREVSCPSIFSFPTMFYNCNGTLRIHTNHCAFLLPQLLHVRAALVVTGNCRRRTNLEGVCDPLPVLKR